MKRGGFLKRTTPLRTKTRLRIKGISETADVKQEIQDTVREIVILRDGGCVLRDVCGIWGISPCNGYRKDGALILQADHLISRGNSATYADTRLVVCVCQGHHGWKSLGSNLRKKQYDAIVRTLISKDRVALWDASEADSWRPVRTGAYDWKLALIALKQELAKLVKTATSKDNSEHRQNASLQIL